MKKNSLVSILMGSQSDWDIMKNSAKALKEFGVSYDVRVMSAHRTPDLVQEYVRSSPEKGVSVFICGAGGAAHLAGVVASHTILPVIGVPVGNGALKGIDSLLSTVQMPKGMPVAAVAIDGAYNAGLLAVQILAVQSSDLQEKLKHYRQEMQEKIKAQSDSLQNETV